MPRKTIGSGDAGQANDCGGSLPYLAGECDGAAGFFDCRFGDGETETGSTRGACAGGIGAIETVEDVGEIVVMYAFAVVLNSYFEGITLERGPDLYL